ncbi:MAG: hypothetical protein WCF18_22105 [Chthoniobacteraceae bacterium]
MADITYIPTNEGWLYVAGVLDRGSRRVLGLLLFKDFLEEPLHQRLHQVVILHHQRFELRRVLLIVLSGHGCYLGSGCLVAPAPTMTRFLFAELSGHYLFATLQHRLSQRRSSICWTQWTALSRQVDSLIRCWQFGER